VSWTIQVSNPDKQRDFLFSKMSMLALGPTQPPLQRVAIAFNEVNEWGVGLTSHINLTQRLRTSGASNPQMPFMFYTGKTLHCALG